MTDENTGEWIECVVDSDYEIFSEYPYPIRRKGSERIIKESVKNDGYVQCSLNHKTYLKHRVIAIQFISNDDPENKPFIDHRNRNRADNRISNLHWVSISDNNKNKTAHKGYQYTYLDELPETAEPLERYNNHEFDGLFIDYENYKLYLFVVDVGYRVINASRRKGFVVYQVKDIANNYVRLFHGVLFG